MGFWSAYMGIEGGGGAAPATDPVDGWIVFARDRVWTPDSRERVWIAPGRVS